MSGPIHGRQRFAIVVGGSLGGLSSAGWLAAHGLRVQVFERSPVPLRGRGAGIVLHPETAALLTDVHGFGLDDFSIAVDEVAYLGRDGHVEHSLPARYRFAAWDRLYELMHDVLPRNSYHLGVRVEKVTDVGGAGDGGQVFTSELLEHHADLVVVADGAASQLRDSIAGRVVSVDAGYLAWRGTVSLEGGHPAMGSRITYALVDDGHMLTYPIAKNADGSGLLNWLWYRTVGVGPALERMLTDITGERRSASVPPHLVDPAQVSLLTEQGRVLLPPILADIVDATDQPFVQVIADLQVDRTVSGHRCLVGDAAFVARPHAAAGTAKASAEGRLLAQAVSSANDIPAALVQFEREQIRQARELVRRSAEAGSRLQISRNWPAGRALPFGLRRPGDSQFSS